MEKAIFYGRYTTQINKKLTMTYTTEDFAQLNGTYLYKGRSPKHDNEAAIGGVMAKELGVTIGDKITIDSQGGAEKYLICGLGQSGENNGWTAQLTIDGIRRMNSNYRHTSIYTYAADSHSSKTLKQTIETELGDKVTNVVDMKESQVALDIYMLLIFIITMVILTITALIIGLVLYLTVKSSIVRRRRSLGIQKAMGYTTVQLMQQMAISFMPAIILGVGFGGILGGLCANPVYSILFRSIGFMKVEFTVLPVLIMAACMLICLFAYLVAIAVSYKIRKISPYTLVSE